MQVNGTNIFEKKTNPQPLPQKMKGTRNVNVDMT